METYTERVKGAVIEEQFTYSDCLDDSATFSPPQTHIRKVQLDLVRAASTDGRRLCLSRKLFCFELAYN